MDDKQIMIDDVDVSDCPYYINKDGSCSSHDCECVKCAHNVCFYKDYKAKEQECEQLRNKLNSSIERMNEQNEKLHNEIQAIKQQMKTILMVSNNGKYRPVKNSTKKQCYQVLGNIQELLGTNIIRFGEVDNE